MTKIDKLFNLIEQENNEWLEEEGWFIVEDDDYVIDGPYDSKFEAEEELSHSMTYRGVQSHFEVKYGKSTTNGYFIKLKEDFEDEHGIGDDNDLYQEQFEKGQEVEKEHTKTLERLYDLAVSKDVPSKEEFVKLGVDSIAMDHLHEFDTYYTALKKMESELKAAQE
jgi:hypothetical protein